MNELQEVLEEQRQEQIAEKRVLEKQKSALGDAELEVGFNSCASKLLT